MGDAMNFGPEWLRNLSSEGTTTGAPKYQLAEFRYGREEMLALFDKTAKPPERLTRLQGLFVEKCQVPVALIIPTEEETRIWNKCINSDAVLRVNGKMPTVPPGAMRGRGTSIDRGRGRGRGAPAGFYYNRGNFDEAEIQGKEGGPMERPFIRSSRSFDRNQMGDRGWPERNGAEPTDWNGSTSPRKEYGGMMRGGMDNWRRSRDDEDGWRPRDKWSSRPSWREEGGDGSGGRSSNWGRGWAEEGHQGRRGTIDEVPEWATADSHEPSGTFDASGAFHGYSSDEVEGQSENSNRRESIKSKLFMEGREMRRGVSLQENNDTSRRKNSEGDSPSGGGLVRSKTAAELGPTTVQSSQNTISKSASSATLSDAQVFDRIRTQHQNFVSKTESENGVEKHLSKPPSHNASELIPSPTPVPAKPQSEPKVSAPVSEPSVGPDREVIKPVLEVARQNSEEDIARLPITVDSVVRMIEEEDVGVKNLQTAASQSDKWYYRDPQGNEQGPFASRDMLSWYMNGYFLPNLLVRREREEIYHCLGDLTSLNGGQVPFLPATSTIPPAVAPAAPVPAVAAAAATADNFPYHLLAQAQAQQQLRVSENDILNAMPRTQRDAFLAHRLLMNQPNIPANPVTQMLSAPFAHFLHQFQQQSNLASQVHQDIPMTDQVRNLLLLGPQGPPAPHHLPIPNLSHIAPPSVPHPLHNSVLAGVASTDLKKDETVQSALSKIQSANKVAMQPDQKQPQRSTVDSLWSGPGRPWTNGLAGAPNVPLWNVNAEAEIAVAEQQKLQQRVEEERLKEEKRKLEELRKIEEERLEREAAEERRRAEEEERKRKDTEDKLRREREERQKLEEAKKQQLEEKKRHEELKKLEEKKRLEEAKKAKMEEKRLMEEAKRIEEITRKKEEKQKKKQAEEETKLKEERVRLMKELEEEAKQEQQRRQEEALRCLKQQQLKSRMKPWSQNTHTPASLAEIQAQEKEKKLLMQREQQNVQELLTAQANELARENELQNSRSNGLNLTWAENPPPQRDNVKSLAEIQAEEQRQLAKQLEKERQERAQQQRDLPVNAGIWSGASGLTWASNNSSPWGTATSNPTPAMSLGFWDENSTKTKVKSPLSPVKSKQQANSTSSNSAPNVKKQQKTNTKTKPASKRGEEAAIRKIFEFEPQGDEFTRWCISTLESMEASIDVQTFTSFLRDIESPYEVKDYVKTYLGEDRESAEFANQFLERRSRWRSAQKTSIEEDDMCAPAPAINPTSPMTEQDNGKKGKKSKKGKMLKVDSRILGFNVTAAQNRINVGQRETWDPNS